MRTAFGHIVNGLVVHLRSLVPWLRTPGMIMSIEPRTIFRYAAAAHSSV